MFVCVKKRLMEIEMAGNKSQLTTGKRKRRRGDNRRGDDIKGEDKENGTAVFIRSGSGNMTVVWQCGSV